MSGPCTDCGGPDYQTLVDRIAEMEKQLEAADEMNAALEWLDNGYVVRAAAKLSRLDTAQRVYADLRARANEGIRDE